MDKIQCQAINNGNPGRRAHNDGEQCRNWAIWEGLCAQHLAQQEKGLELVLVAVGRPQRDRRERPRGNGAMRRIEDAAHKVLREHQ